MISTDVVSVVVVTDVIVVMETFEYGWTVE
jgi:hypothetical protein